jgi:hypothetical protein
MFTTATDSIALDNKTALSNILKAIGLFQTIDRHITLESVKAFLVVAMKENLSSNEYARMANTGSAQMSYRLGVLGELKSNLQPGHGLVESRPDPLDRRLTLVRLTDKGKALAGQLARAVEFGSRTLR